MADPDGSAGVAVVTGASQGIGREIALAFARAGYDLVLAARSRGGLEETGALVQGHGVRSLVVECDVCEEDSVAHLASRVTDEFGRVDALVCNAGIAGPTAELWTVALDDWEETFRVNVTGTFLICRAFLPLMIERSAGTVVVIGSMTGKRPLHGRTPYAASKLALVGLIRSLAWEAGPHGIRVNLISPGAVEGPRIEAVLQRQAQSRGVTVEEARGDFSSASPMQRLVRAQEVADAAVFLASPAAAGVTGEDLNVTSGQAMF